MVINSPKWKMLLRRIVLAYPAFFVLFLAHFGASFINGQVDPLDTEPPPMRTVSKEERTQLDAITDVKKRTKFALDLMSGRLKQAETAQTNAQFDEMFERLGGFHGLMDNTLAYLDNSNVDRGKVLNNYKRFEIGIREFRPRLEILRRDLPLRYEAYVRTLIKHLRDARTKAVEPLFGDSVIPRTKP